MPRIYPLNGAAFDLDKVTYVGQIQSARSGGSCTHTLSCNVAVEGLPELISVFLGELTTETMIHPPQTHPDWATVKGLRSAFVLAWGG